MPTDPVNIDEGERLLAAAESVADDRVVVWSSDIEAWIKWARASMPAMLAELRELREQVSQLTQARDAGGDDAR